ncbi:MAG: YceI family protein [Flavobacteriales bacterium]|jgi:polyisoprenoid-binding protein YceI|nr:YceI family protein [Flavobacteriales bacterium]
MKKIVLTLAVALMSTFAFATGGEGEGESTTLKVVTNESTLNWVGEKVTGSHMGTLNIREGIVVLDQGMIDKAMISIDMSSITVTDEGMDDETKANLKGHLASADFFNVAEHETADFKLTSFAPYKGEGANYMVKGQLTIKGITQPIEFPVNATMKDDMVTVSADLTFDRSKFDIRYGSDSFFDNLGDKVIYDDVKVSFTLVARK